MQALLVLQVVVAGCIASRLKDHQKAGIRFLWRNVVLEHEVVMACIMHLVQARPHTSTQDAQRSQPFVACTCKQILTFLLAMHHCQELITCFCCSCLYVTCDGMPDYAIKIMRCVPAGQR